MRNLYLLFVFILMLDFSVKGSVFVDSLFVELKQAQNQEKADILNIIAKYFALSNKEKSVKYGYRALEISKELDYEEGIANAFYALGVANRHELLISLEYLSKAGELFKRIGFNNYSCDVLQRIGNLHFEHCNYSKALKYYIECHKIAVQIDDRYLIAASIQNTGNIYFMQGEYENAVKKYSEAFEVFSSINYSRGIAGCNMNIGVVFHKQGNYFDAMNHYKKSLSIYDSLLKFNQDIESSNDVYLDKNSIAKCLQNIGEIYLELKDYDKALDNLYGIISLHANTDNFVVIKNAYEEIGHAYFDKGDYKRALEYSLKAMDIVQSSELKYLGMSVHRQLAIIYDSIGNTEESFRHYKLYVVIKDSVFSKEKKRVIENLIFGNKAEIIENKIGVLEQENNVNRQKKIALVIVVALIILISIVLFFLQYSKNINTKELIEKRISVNRSNQLLMETRINNTIIERKRLQSELELKSRRLTNIALHIVHKNDMLSIIKKEVAHLRKNAISSDALNIINEMYTITYQLLNIEKDLTEFKIHVKDINESFFLKLSQSFPNLTKTETHIAALLRLDLSSKQMSSILNISVKSIEMNRYRLRKKLGLKHNDNISKIMNKI